MKVKRIIEIEEEIIAEMEKFPHRAIKIVKNRDCSVADAILNSKPYDDSGDLISRSELLKHTQGGDYDGVGFSKEYVYVDDINNAPTVEAYTLEDMQNNFDAGVDSVIGKYDKAKGEWIKWNFKTFGPMGDWEYKCSNCEKVYGGKYNYCPNCGADMKGGAE